MSLDEAIRAAMEYEGKVHKTYSEAMQAATDDKARRFFKTLCDEEKEHLEYLAERLDEWNKTGKITVAELGTAVPPRPEIELGVAKLKEKLAGKTSGKQVAEIELLKRAIDVEAETSAFYKKMVGRLDAEGQQMFQRFVEIEQGHLAIVQAELDLVTGTGFWFDTPEFSLEL
jgi:rubrerythrin